MIAPPAEFAIRTWPIASRHAAKKQPLFAITLHHRPRFPALALFRRRLSARVDSLGMPASKSLHMSDREQLQQIFASSTGQKRGKAVGLGLHHSPFAFIGIAQRCFRSLQLA